MSEAEEVTLLAQCAIQLVAQGWAVKPAVAEASQLIQEASRVRNELYRERNKRPD